MQAVVSVNLESVLAYLPYDDILIIYDINYDEHEKELLVLKVTFDCLPVPSSISFIDVQSAHAY